MSAAASSTIAVVLPDGEMPEPVESESSLDEPAEDEATVAASQLSGPDACFDRPEITAAEGHESHNSSRVFRPPIA